MQSGIAAEQSVIGGCLIDNDAYWKIAGIVRSTDFTLGFHVKTFEAIELAANAGDAFDAVTLSETTRLDLSDLLLLANETPGSANIETYARIVRDASTARAASKIVGDAQTRLLAGDIDAIADLHTQLEGLHRSERPATRWFEALQHGLDSIEKASVRAKADGGIIGAPTSVPVIDARMRGLTGGKLIILAARPSLGKTALALQAAQGAAKAGFPVGVLSLEMGTDEIAIRAFAHQYQVNNTALSYGEPEVVGQLTSRVVANEEHRATLNNLPIYIDEDTFDIPGILARISEWHRKHNIQLVIVDHLQLVELPRNKNRNDGLGDVTRSLKLLAKRLDIPVMLLCQLSREVEKQGREPKLSDLRDSGNIEQDADVVIALHGDLETASTGFRTVNVNFLKYRGGLVGWAGSMVFNGATQTFRQAETRYGDE